MVGYMTFLNILKWHHNDELATLLILHFVLNKSYLLWKYVIYAFCVKKKLFIVKICNYQLKVMWNKRELPSKISTTKCVKNIIKDTSLHNMAQCQFGIIANDSCLNQLTHCNTKFLYYTLFSMVCYNEIYHQISHQFRQIRRCSCVR